MARQLNSTVLNIQTLLQNQGLFQEFIHLLPNDLGVIAGKSQQQWPCQWYCMFIYKKGRVFLA